MLPSLPILGELHALEQRGNGHPQRPGERHERGERRIMTASLKPRDVATGEGCTPRKLLLREPTIFAEPLQPPPKLLKSFGACHCYSSVTLRAGPTQGLFQDCFISPPPNELPACQCGTNGSRSLVLEQDLWGDIEPGCHFRSREESPAAFWGEVRQDYGQRSHGVGVGGPSGVVAGPNTLLKLVDTIPEKERRTLQDSRDCSRTQGIASAVRGLTAIVRCERTRKARRNAVPRRRMEGSVGA